MEKLFGNFHRISRVSCIFLIIGFTFYSCSVIKSVPPGTKKYKTKPTGNVFFMDKKFISNGSWTEYLIFLKNKFGKNSEKYLSMLPDSLIWNQKYEGGDISKLFSLYNDAPIIGVNFKQIKAYCKFRLNRIEIKYHKKYICRLPRLKESIIFHKKNNKYHEYSNLIIQNNTPAILSINSNNKTQVYSYDTERKNHKFYFFCVFERKE